MSELPPSPIRPMRGRVVVRPDDEAPSKIIIDPRRSSAEQQQRDRNVKIHRGTVLAVGPPARDQWGHERPPGFDRGDRILFVYAQWLEKMRHFDDFAVVSQEEVQAVLEP
jgi:co-chaperonin GroES (HSP10)